MYRQIGELCVRNIRNRHAFILIVYLRNNSQILSDLFKRANCFQGYLLLSKGIPKSAVNALDQSDRGVAILCRWRVRNSRKQCWRYFMLGSCCLRFNQDRIPAFVGSNYIASRDRVTKQRTGICCSDLIFRPGRRWFIFPAHQQFTSNIVALKKSPWTTQSVSALGDIRVCEK